MVDQRALRVLVALGLTSACGSPPSEASPGEVADNDAPASSETPAAAADSGDAAPAEAANTPKPDVGDTPLAGQPETPAIPETRPEDFGELKPAVPPPAEEALTVHSLAGYEVVAIYSQPDLSSPRLGYLRFGQRMMVTAKIDDTGEGCKKGFHALPMGGFACASKGLIVKEDKAPYMYLPPPPPRVDEPLPYDYGTVARDGTPMWWRIADSDEVRLADDKYDATVAPPDDPATPTKTKPKTKPQAKPSGDKPKPADPKVVPPKKTELPGVADVQAPPPRELTEEEKKELERKKAAAAAREAARKEAEAERAAELAKKAANLPLNSSTPFMEKGFTITISERVREKGRGWWRTTRGGFVESSRAWRRKTKDFSGGEIAETSGFPFGFVMEEKAAASEMTEKGTLKWKRKLQYRELLDFTEEVELDGRPYLVTAEGLYVRAKDIRLAVPAERPDDIAPWERWIDVSLALQILVAYDGEQPVYATLVSTGKKGTAEESFATPKGQWRIRSKHISSSMDGNTASDGNYSIQDVPWTMFFEGSYALHGAFWHSRFGRRRSHGCVNLGPTDARWVFNWTTPNLPEGWHGVNAHEGAPGTMVVVH